MQLDRHDDGSSKDKDDQDREDCFLFKELPHDRQVSVKIQTTAKIPTTLRDLKPADFTPPPKASLHPPVFVPPTPSQNKHKDIFGSGDTDLSEPSDGSDVDSMKALSQKLAARTDSLITITKRASILPDTVFSAGVSGKKIANRRVLDSDDEEALSSSRKGAKDDPNPGVNAKKAMPTVAVSDEDDLPPPPAPLKSK